MNAQMDFSLLRFQELMRRKKRLFIDFWSVLHVSSSKLAFFQNQYIFSTSFAWLEVLRYSIRLFIGNTCPHVPHPARAIVIFFIFVMVIKNIFFLWALLENVLVLLLLKGNRVRIYIMLNIINLSSFWLVHF